jgi:hypothetical protein
VPGITPRTATRLGQCARRGRRRTGKSTVVRRRTGGEDGATRGAALEASWGADGLGNARPRAARGGARTARQAGGELGMACCGEERAAFIGGVDG